MKFLFTFIGLSIINVIFSTFRTILTVNGDKLRASVVSGAYFAFYNVMLIYTVADFPMWQKCLITFICNVIGVYVVKYLEEKARKDKLWKVEFTVLSENTTAIHELLSLANIPHNFIENVGKYTIFNAFCASQSQSDSVSEIIKEYNAKYFVSETKLLK